MTSKMNINAVSAVTKPVAGDFSSAALYAASGTANFKATKYTLVATPAESAVMTVTSANTTAANFSGTASGDDKANWTWGGADSICTTSKICKFKAKRALAAATEAAANTELEAVRTFAKTTVAAAAMAKDTGGSPTWAHGDMADADLTAGVAAAAAAAAGAMSLGAVAAAIATLSMAF